MLYLGADHGGFELKESIKKYLDEKGIEYEDCGTYSADSVDYALIAKKTCDKIVAGEGNKGIQMCFAWAAELSAQVLHSSLSRCS